MPRRPRKSDALAPTNITVEVKGLNQLLSNLNNADRIMANDVLDEAVFNAAKNVAVHHIRAWAPVDTGNLAASLTAKKLKPRHKKSGSSVASIIGPAKGMGFGVFYAIMLETGTEPRYTATSVTWRTPDGQFRTTRYRGFLRYGHDRFMRHGLMRATGAVVHSIQAFMRGALAAGKKFGKGTG